MKILIVFVAAIGFSSWASAADLHQAIHFDIPRQPLAQALADFSRQSDVIVVAKAEATEGKISKAIKEIMTPAEALKALLDGTQLQYRQEKDGAVVVGRPGAAGEWTNEGMRVAEAPEGVSGEQNDPTQRVKSSHDGTKSSSGEKTNSESSGNSEDKLQGIVVPEILVRGSKILNMDMPRSRDDAQPYVIFNREAIAASGTNNLEEFLKTRLTMNTVAGTNSQGTTAFGSTSQINLRGLGSNQTLILVDGHRTSSLLNAGGPTQSDINAIPLAAIERVEVLPTTASGIYGGGATGGVVNIILRRDYAGAEAKLTYENTFDSDVGMRRVDLSTGFNLEGGKTNVLLAGSYSDQNPLLMGERDLYREGRARVLANNPASATYFGATPPLGATPNIRSVNGSALFGAGTANFASVPVGYAGGGGRTPLQTNAGRYNFDLAPSTQASGGTQQSLLNGPIVESLTATIRRQFSSRIQAFLDLSASNNDGRVVTGDGQTTGVYTVALTAPNNPFGQAIRVTVPLAGRPMESIAVGTNDRRAVAGLIAQLPGRWKAEGDLTWNRSGYGYALPTKLSADAATAISNGTIDVLRDTVQFPLNLSAYTVPGDYTSRFHSTLKDATVRVAGPLVGLPAGSIGMSSSLEYRDEAFAEATQYLPSSNQQIIYPSMSQSVESAYIELKVPLFSSALRRPGFEELEVQLAGRWDRYRVDGATGTIIVSPGVTPAAAVRRSTTASSVNPTVGLRWRPVHSVLLRGSYGTGFLPPTVRQLVADPAFPSLGFFGLVDPLRGNQPITSGNFTSGGNVNINPEKSESFSAGIVLEPAFLPTTRISVDYTRIAKEDNITDPLALINSNFASFMATYPDRITRAPLAVGDPFTAGQITAVDGTLLNIARAKLEAYDVSVDHRFDIGRFGSLSAFVLATWQTHYETQLRPTDAFVENVGITASFPLKFKANAGLNWQRAGWSAGWTARYFDSYIVSTTALVVLNQGSDRVSSQLYHDAFLSYAFARERNETRLARVLSGTELMLGGKNVFNKAPPFSAASTATFFSPFGDPRLASYYISLKRAF